MLNVTMTGDRELIAKLNNMPAAVQRALYAKVSELAVKLEAHIKQDKLQGQVLNHQSGALQRSIFSIVTQSAESVIGKVAQSGDVKYGAIHEFGGTIPAHVVTAKSASALAFVWRGKQVFFKSVNIPAITMPERSFMRSALADMKDEIIKGMTDAVKEGLKK